MPSSEVEVTVVCVMYSSNVAGVLDDLSELVDIVALRCRAVPTTTLWISPTLR